MVSPRHKVFISYHHANDERYRIEFERLFASDLQALISRAVKLGDIEPGLKTETIRQRIRDEHLRDSSVTVVLVGTQTWQRRHVDWEISSSIRRTEFNPRSGLLGLLLPTRTDYRRDSYHVHTIPPRLHDNAKSGFARIYNWTDNHDKIREWVHDAFVRRTSVDPDNSRDLYRHNRSGAQWQ